MTMKLPTPTNSTKGLNVSVYSGGGISTGWGWGSGIKSVSQDEVEDMKTRGYKVTETTESFDGTVTYTMSKIWEGDVSRLQSKPNPKSTVDEDGNVIEIEDDGEQPQVDPDGNVLQPDIPQLESLVDEDGNVLKEDDEWDEDDEDDEDEGEEDEWDDPDEQW